MLQLHDFYPSLAINIYAFIILIIHTVSVNGQFVVEVVSLFILILVALHNDYEFKLEPARMGMRRSVQRCEATGANFGADIVTFSFGHEAIGCAAHAIPIDACADVTSSSFEKKCLVC
ncbi:unnamed protein product [Cylicostephanus goldi]|uniref:Uncharacterized protein n=1 Tax=Cylicostephanus goldi TaxID=71465 RepID=A0A3P6S2Y3_CYLGO|nr:unnamed protein product [Cylicostephanus goldi]